MNSKMPDLDNTIKSALKFLCGAEKLVCRLCITCIQSEIEAVTIEDSVTLDRHYFQGTVTFNEIFQELGIAQEHSLPMVLCMDCALRTIDTYLFQLFCQYSNTKWANILENFEKHVPQPDEIHHTTKNVYIITDNCDMPWVTCSKPLKEKICENAVVQLKKSIVNKKKNILKRSSRRTCKECGETFNDLSSLREHLSKIHEINETQKHKCSQCSKQFLKREHLTKHMERVHTTKTIPCSLCKKKFGTNRILRIHFKQHHTPVECTSCLITLPSRNDLLKHSELHTKMKCPNCSKTFTSKIGFRDHLLLICGGVKTEKFYCDICNREFTRKSGVRNHIKVVHGFGKVYSCEYCDKKYAAISSLKQHEVKHTKEKKFNCEQCGGLFVTLAALTYHTRIHTGEKPYPCDICGERFLSASRRMAHKYRKHLGPHKQCELCPSKFVTSHQLRKHMERHYNPQSKLFLSHLSHEPPLNIVC